MNVKYWTNRAEQILLNREEETEKYINKILTTYRQTQDEIDREINRVFNKYANDGKLTKKEAVELLNTKESNEYYSNLLKQIQRVKEEDTRRELLNKYNSLAYNYRISRLEALKNDIYIKCKIIADQELEYSSKHYAEIFNNSYNDYQVLISENLIEQGISLSNINNTLLENVLNTKWLGSNYSTRIWKNSDLLIRMLNSTLSNGILAGQSIQKLSKKLDEIMQAGMFNATRLIRTETNYFHNQAELKAYADDGIEAYKYLAILDSRTSEICRELNGKIFNIKDAVVGENYPPMHPFCRSTTIPITDLEDKIELQQDLKGKNENNQKMNFQENNEKLESKIIRPTIDEDISRKNNVIKYENIIMKLYNNNKNENMAILNVDTGKLIGNITQGKERTQVGLDTTTMIKLILSKANSVLVIHNHPENYSFSLMDILTFNKYKQIGMMSALTPNYKFYLAKSKDFKTLDSKQLTKLYKDVEKNIDKRYNFLNRVERRDLVNQDFFKKIGWIYEKEKNKKL